MKASIDRTRAQLGDLAGLTAKTEAAERRILAAAEKRLDEVQALIERARPGIEAAPDSAQGRYLDLVTERGQLQTVIGKARQALPGA